MKKKKIMVVDDDRDFLNELGEMLFMAGYDLVAVSDTQEAVAIARKVDPALVLVDLKMPGKNGFQLADELRHCPECFNTPIIAMSGYYKPEYDPLLQTCGIRKCIKKPFQPLDVIMEIEKILEGDLQVE